METIIITNLISLGAGIALGIYVSSQISNWIDKNTKSK